MKIYKNLGTIWPEIKPHPRSVFEKAGFVCDVAHIAPTNLKKETIISNRNTKCFWACSTSSQRSVEVPRGPWSDLELEISSKTKTF